MTSLIAFLLIYDAASTATLAVLAARGLNEALVALQWTLQVVGLTTGNTDPIIATYFNIDKIEEEVFQGLREIRCPYLAQLSEQNPPIEFILEEVGLMPDELPRVNNHVDLMTTFERAINRNPSLSCSIQLSEVHELINHLRPIREALRTPNVFYVIKGEPTLIAARLAKRLNQDFPFLPSYELTPESYRWAVKDLDHLAIIVRYIIKLGDTHVGNASSFVARVLKGLPPELEPLRGSIFSVMKRVASFSSVVPWPGCVSKSSWLEMFARRIR